MVVGPPFAIKAEGDLSVGIECCYPFDEVDWHLALGQHLLQGGRVNLVERSFNVVCQDHRSLSGF